MYTERAEIDICIPCLNGGVVIVETIKSCTSTHPIRIIVGLNACTDGTKQRLESLGLDNLVVKDFEDRVDMVENWIRTLRFCDSPYVKLLPAGDKLLPGALDHQLDVLAAACKTGDVGLVASKKAISHKYPMVSWLINSIIKQKGDETQVMSTMELFSEIERLPRNIFGEPGCVLFKQVTLRSLLYKDESFTNLGRLYPYVVDLIMYIEAIKSSPGPKSCVFDSRTVCCFEISRSSGTWKLRKRQLADLLGYCNYLGLRPGIKAKAISKAMSIVRELVYAIT
jgi:glycosyltransferase involved in cell wall biosynthesis